MIGKQSKGRNIYHVLQYVMTKPGAEVLGGHLVSANVGISQIAHEMQQTWQHNTRIQRPVYHASLSLPPHEYLNSQTWHQIAREYLQNMGFGRVPYLVVRHTDTDYDHIHIVAGRLNLETQRCVKDNWDALRSRQVIQQLETQYGLTPTAPAWSKEQTPATVSMVRQQRRTGQASIKQQLQTLIDSHCTKSLQLRAFVESLKEQGVEIAIALTPTQQAGIIYHYQGLHFTGSQLGRSYTLNGLQTYKQIEIPSSAEAIVEWWNTQQTHDRTQKQQSTQTRTAQLER